MVSLAVGVAVVCAVLGLIGALVSIVQGVRHSRDPVARAAEAEDPVAFQHGAPSPGPALRALARVLDGGRASGPGTLSIEGTTAVEGGFEGRAVRVTLEVVRKKSVDGWELWQTLSLLTDVSLPGEWRAYRPMNRVAEVVVGGIIDLTGIERTEPVMVEARGLRLEAPRGAASEGRARAPLQALLDDEPTRLALDALTAGRRVELKDGRLAATGLWTPGMTDAAALRQTLELVVALARRLDETSPERPRVRRPAPDQRV